MISYQGKSFCSQPCANTECSRNLNDDVLARARAWWETFGRYDEPPIDKSDMRTGECGFSELIK